MHDMPRWEKFVKDVLLGEQEDGVVLKKTK